MNPHPTGLFKMLLELSPTLSDKYYPGVRPLKAVKSEQDARSAAAGQGQGRPVPVAPSRTEPMAK